MKTKTDSFLKVIQTDNHLVMLRIHGQVDDFVLSLFYSFSFSRWNKPTVLKVPSAPLSKGKKKLGSVSMDKSWKRLFLYNPGAVLEAFGALFLPWSQPPSCPIGTCLYTSSLKLQPLHVHLETMRQDMWSSGDCYRQRSSENNTGLLYTEKCSPGRKWV